MWSTLIRGILPTLLTLSRIVAAPGIVWLIVHGRYEWALGVFGVAIFTDFLDGFLARRWKGGSNLGRILDPLADKILLLAVLISLGWRHALSPWILGLFLAKDGALLVGGAVLFSRGMTMLPPCFMGKLNAVLQMALCGGTLWTLHHPTPLDSLWIQLISFATLLTTLGALYQYSREGIQVWRRI